MRPVLARLVTSFAIVAAVSIGCANPGVMQVESNVYVLRWEDHAGVFGSLAKLKADVIAEAQAFAESKGKVAVRLSEREHSVGTTPADWAWFEYTFRLADRDEDEKRRAEEARVDKCFARLETDPSLGTLRGKIALVSIKEQPFEMLIDNSKPTETELVAIGLWAKMRSRCWEDLEAFNERIGIPAAMVALLGSTKNTQMDLIVLLHGGSITYGEFARMRIDLHDEMVKAAVAINDELEKRSADAQARADQLALQAQQVDLQRIQARQAQLQTHLMGIQTANALQQTATQRQMLDQMRAPRQTNCRIFGSRMDCTTW